MQVTRIYDNELLPLNEQLDLIELSAKDSPSHFERTRRQLRRIQNRLNQDFSRARLSVLDYVDLSVKLSNQSARFNVNQP